MKHRNECVERPSDYSNHKQNDTEEKISPQAWVIQSPEVHLPDSQPHLIVSSRAQPPIFSTSLGQTYRLYLILLTHTHYVGLLAQE